MSIYGWAQLYGQDTLFAADNRQWGSILILYKERRPAGVRYPPPVAKHWQTSANPWSRAQDHGGVSGPWPPLPCFPEEHQPPGHCSPPIHVRLHSAGDSTSLDEHATAPPIRLLLQRRRHFYSSRPKSLYQDRSGWRDQKDITNFIRLNAANWSVAAESAMEQLGEIVARRAS